MSADLILVAQSVINGETVQAVNARELHAFLKVNTEFKDWISRRIKEYGFIEGEDFSSFLSESSGGRPAKEYAITLDMAKEISMVERNKKGKEARQYFIECERQLKGRRSAPRLPSHSKAISVHTSLARAMIKLAGVNPGIAAAVMLENVRKETGMDTESYRRLLPGTTETPESLNATNLGKAVGMTARETNQILADLGMQQKNKRGEWELTEKGKDYGAAYPFARNGHASHQILWLPATAKLLGH